MCAGGNFALSRMVKKGHGLRGWHCAVTDESIFAYGGIGGDIYH